MAPWLPSLLNALPCVFVLLVTLWEAETDSVARPSGFVHQGRSLTFPYGFGESYLEFTFGVGLPMNLPSPYQVSMSLEMRADYKYPVNASDFTNPTKRREEEEKEKEEMEKEKEKKGKSKEKKSVKVADVQHSSVDVNQTRANSRVAKIGDKKLNNSDTLNSTECQGGMDKHIEKFKFMANEDNSNITANVGDVTKGGCYGKGSNNTNTFETANKANKLVTKQKEVYLQKSWLSEFKDVAGNFTHRPEYDDFTGKDLTNKTNKNSKQNTHNENTNHDDANEREGGARFIRKRDTAGRSTRWRIYHVLEMAASNLGMDGRACLLRSICDAAATPLHHMSNELVGELLHVLFTPSTTDDDRGRYLDNEYRAAERLGSDVGNNCELLYPECDVSFLDLITTFDLF